MSHRSCGQRVGVGALKTRPSLAMTDSHARAALCEHTALAVAFYFLSHTHSETPQNAAQWISTLFSVPSAWFSWLEPI